MEPEAILPSLNTPTLEALIATPQPLSEKLGPIYEDSPNRPIRRRIGLATAIVIGLTLIPLSAIVVIALVAVFGA